MQCTAVARSNFLSHKGMSRCTISEDKYYLLCIHCSETEESSKVKSCKAVRFSGVYIYIYIYMEVSFNKCNSKFTETVGKQIKNIQVS